MQYSNLYWFRVSLRYFSNQNGSFPWDMHLIFHELLEENSTASSWNMRSIRPGKLSIWSKKLAFFEVIFFGAFIIGTPIVMDRWLGVLQRCTSGQQINFARDWTVLEGYSELEGLLQNLAGRRPLLTLCETLFPGVFWACHNPATDMCQNLLDLWQILRILDMPSWSKSYGPQHITVACQLPKCNAILTLFGHPGHLPLEARKHCIYCRNR